MPQPSSPPPAGATPQLTLDAGLKRPRRTCPLCDAEVLVAVLDGRELALDFRELIPLQPCPRCGPMDGREDGPVGDLRERHGSVQLQHRSSCRAKGRDPRACVCDPRAYLAVDGDQTPAGRLPHGWSSEDIAALYERLPRRRPRASIQLQHIRGCPAKGRDHERCGCSPRAYVYAAGKFSPAGHLPEGWGPDDVAALLQPKLEAPRVDAELVDTPTRREADDHVVAELGGACPSCRGRGTIGAAIADVALYAIDAAGAVRPVTLGDRRRGDALHRPHAPTCAACTAGDAVAA